MITNEEVIKTIIAFADNNMNRTLTGRELFISNTAVYFRLKRINTMTGINPEKFYGLIELLSKIKRGENLI